MPLDIRRACYRPGAKSLGAKIRWLGIRMAFEFKAALLLPFAAGLCIIYAAYAWAQSGDCSANWIEFQFYKDAEVAEITHCLENGAPVEAQDFMLSLSVFRNSLDNQLAIIPSGGFAVGATPLHMAAASSSASIVETLVGAGANRGARDQSGSTPLHWAAMLNDGPGVSNVIQVLAHSEANPNSENEDGLSPIHLAARYNSNPDAVSALIEIGVDLNKLGSGFTPLHYSAIGNEPEVVAALLNFGADAYASALDGSVPWDLAKNNRRLAGHSVLNRLRPARQTTLFADSQDRCAYWNSAGFFGSATIDLVRLCIESGADLQARDAFGATPLHFASAFGQGADIVTLLLEHGADGSATDRFGSTPLHRAARQNEGPYVSSVIRALARSDANPNFANISGLSPIHLAAQWNRNPNAISALIEIGADLDKLGSGFTPLHYSAMGNYPEVVAALLNSGANVDAMSPGGSVPWDLAKYNGLLAGHDILNRLRPARQSTLYADSQDRCADWNSAGFFKTVTIDLVKLCIESGEDLQVRDPIGATPLHFASAFGLSAEIVSLLLEEGADSGAIDKSGSSPLHWAAWLNDGPDVSSVIQTLADAQANPNSANKGGLSPIHLAAQWNRNPDAVLALVEVGAELDRPAKGFMPLHYSAIGNEPEVVAALLNSGADANAMSPGGRIPWDLAKNNQLLADHDILDRLRPTRQFKLDTNYLDDCDNLNSATFFLSATSDIVKQCIEGGADLNARGRFGWTPLHYASKFGQSEEIISLLLDAGANPLFRTESDLLPFDFAIGNPKLANTPVLERLDPKMLN